MNLFNINFNSNENEFLSLAYGCRNDVGVLNKFDASRVSILSFKKHFFRQNIHFNFSCRNDVAILNKFDANGVS